MDSVVHFEIPVDDLERAKGFYATVFDWDLQPMPEMITVSCSCLPSFTKAPCTAFRIE